MNAIGMQSVGLCLCDRPFILVRTKDFTYYCNAVVIGVPSSKELYVISQNRTLSLKIEEIQEIRLMEMHNPVPLIIQTDIEADSSNSMVFQRIAPSEAEIKEEEELIKKWKKGKIG
jgi:hypothetical protein